MVLDALQHYQQGRNSALGTIATRTTPTQVGDTFTLLLAEIKALPAYLPELEQCLLKYPDAASDQIKSDFYWEKVNFGLKPTHASGSKSSLTTEHLPISPPTPSP